MQSLLDNNHAVIHLEWFQNFVIDDREFFFQEISDLDENIFVLALDVNAARFYCQ